jgi:hypothetical protein
MFGGKTQEGVPTDELYVLNEGKLFLQNCVMFLDFSQNVPFFGWVVNFLWSVPRIVGQKPPAVYGHSLCSFNAYNNKLDNGLKDHDTLLLFGGKGIDTCTNDVYTFSLRMLPTTTFDRKKKIIEVFETFPLVYQCCHCWIRKLKCLGFLCCREI